MPALGGGRAVVESITDHRTVTTIEEGSDCDILRRLKATASDIGTYEVAVTPMSLATHRFPAPGRCHPARDPRACPRARGWLCSFKVLPERGLSARNPDPEFSKNLLSHDEAGTSGGDGMSVSGFRPGCKQEGGDSPVA